MSHDLDQWNPASVEVKVSEGFGLRKPLVQRLAGILLKVNTDDPTMTDILLDGEAVLTLPTAEAPALRDIALVAETGDLSAL